MRTFGITDFWYILQAVQWTVLLSIIAFIGGGLVGLAVALARTGTNRAARALATGFIQVFRGTPLLLQLFLVFFGEIWRGCIEAVPRGQWEAAAALGLNYRTRLRDVILPQALKIAVPPTVGYLVQVIKGTSLAAIIGFTELTRAGQIVNNATFEPMVVFSIVAVLYFLLCWPLSLLAGRMERRLALAQARA
jgi:polar amino acid transport system permease protein